MLAIPGAALEPPPPPARACALAPSHYPTAAASGQLHPGHQLRRGALPIPPPPTPPTLPSSVLQLYLNYKLKSVAHMPWRQMTYKFLNTIIDDLFAFVIKMPLLHRISVFRWV